MHYYAVHNGLGCLDESRLHWWFRQLVAFCRELVEEQGSCHDEDQGDQYQAEVVEQTESLILHNRPMIADQQNGDD